MNEIQFCTCLKGFSESIFSLLTRKGPFRIPLLLKERPMWTAGSLSGLRPKRYKFSCEPPKFSSVSCNVYMYMHSEGGHNSTATHIEAPETARQYNVQCKVVSAKFNVQIHLQTKLEGRNFQAKLIKDSRALKKMQLSIEFRLTCESSETEFLRERRPAYELRRWSSQLLGLPAGTLGPYPVSASLSELRSLWRVLAGAVGSSPATELRVGIPRPRWTTNASSLLQGREYCNYNEYDEVKAGFHTSC